MDNLIDLNKKTMTHDYIDVRTNIKTETAKLLHPVDIIYKKYAFTIPEGYETDFYSIPKWLRWMYDPFGPGKEIAVIHDYIYDTPSLKIKRITADWMFFIGLRDIAKRPWIECWKKWIAVRVGGWIGWYQSRF